MAPSGIKLTDHFLPPGFKAQRDMLRVNLESVTKDLTDARATIRAYHAVLVNLGVSLSMSTAAMDMIATEARVDLSLPKDLTYDTRDPAAAEVYLYEFFRRINVALVLSSSVMHDNATLIDSVQVESHKLTAAKYVIPPKDIKTRSTQQAMDDLAKDWDDTSAVASGSVGPGTLGGSFNKKIPVTGTPGLAQGAPDMEGNGQLVTITKGHKGKAPSVGGNPFATKDETA